MCLVVPPKQVKHLRLLIFECRDPSYQAYKLGMAAAILLALAHVIANSLGGCICFLSRDDNNKATANKQLAVGSLVLSWYVFFVITYHIQQLVKLGFSLFF